MNRLILFIIILIVFSCKKDDIKVEFDYKKFLDMKSHWEQLNINNYSFTYSSFGFGCLSNKYIVKGELVANILPDTLNCRDHQDTTVRYTIDDIFKNIIYRYNNPIIEKYSENSYWYCYEIEIKYDSVYFFPSSYEFKQKGKHMYITDTERVYTITNFRIE
jgi:hypothetical protein